MSWDPFDGGAARMMDVPPFTPAEGATVLAAAGGGWLLETERLDLVRAVDGHALGRRCAGRPLPSGRPAGVGAELLAASRTDTRVSKVLRFYADPEERSLRAG